jgi:hypothetical protein
MDPVGLDPHDDIRRCVLIAEVVSDQAVQRLQSGNALGQASLRQPPAALVDQLHIMMIFGPVITQEQHARLPSARRQDEPRGDRVRPNGSVLDRHDIPPALQTSSPTGTGHDLTLGLLTHLREAVLTGRRLGHSLMHDQTVQDH